MKHQSTKYPQEEERYQRQDIPLILSCLCKYLQSKVKVIGQKEEWHC